MNGSVTGAIPFGVWPGAEQIDGVGGEDRRQTEGGGPATPIKSSVLPLLPEEQTSESGTISSELVCPLNYIYHWQHCAVCLERPVTVEMQRASWAAGGGDTPRKKNTNLPGKFPKHTCTPGKKKFRTELEQELSKGEHSVSQRAGFLWAFSDL